MLLGSSAQQQPLENEPSNVELDLLPAVILSLCQYVFVSMLGRERIVGRKEAERERKRGEKKLFCEAMLHCIVAKFVDTEMRKTPQANCLL